MAMRGDEERERAIAWTHERQAAVCDIAEPWAHGTVLRATGFPDYWDYNVLRVEEEPRMGTADLVAAADAALADAAHRKIDFEDVEAAEPHRAEFAALGWRTFRLVYMRHRVDPGPAPELEVVEVAYDEVNRLRRAWHEEDFPGQEPSGYHAQAREVARRHGARVFSVRRGGELAGFAQLEQIGGSAEITQVYVDAAHRGQGLGTAITHVAIGAAGAVTDLWIGADDEDRPKELYGRLGFRPVWVSMEMIRLPAGDAGGAAVPAEPSASGH